MALAEVDGPEAGLAALAELRGVETLAGYHPYHATRAELLRRAGRADEADTAYGQALGTAISPAERAYLTDRRASLAD